MNYWANKRTQDNLRKYGPKKISKGEKERRAEEWRVNNLPQK
jgi:hypothetical protein